MKYSSRILPASAFSVLGLFAMTACSDQSTTAPGLRPTGAPSRAVVVDARPTYTPPQDAGGTYLLDRVCDVFIGEVAGLLPAETPQKYEHQTVVVVPVGSKIKLVGTAAMQASGSKKFTCDATDRDDKGNANLATNGQPQAVIDPVTLHAARGDGPGIHTDGIDLDLNGYSIESLPSAADLTGDPAFANIAMLMTGSNVTLRNSAVVGEDGVTGVSTISRFGHSFDAQGASITIRGEKFGEVYNLVTTGGVALRNHSGVSLIDKIKSVDDQVDGQGIIVRRCAAGSKSTVSNSYFVGGAEAAFIRECSGVTFENNYLGSNGLGAGITTRQATSTAAAPIIIRGNTVANNLASGIVWGRDSRNNNASLVISGNTVSAWGECGIRISTKGTTFAPLTVASLTAANTFTTSGTRVCRQGD
jgi:hypothetical protein